MAKYAKVEAPHWDLEDDDYSELQVFNEQQNQCHRDGCSGFLKKAA